MKLIARAVSPRMELWHGDSTLWTADERVDLVLTNPYAPLPRCLCSKPMILIGRPDRRNQFEEEFCQQPLTEIARWAGGEEVVWVTPNLLALDGLDLSSIDAERPGWWSLDLPLRLLLHVGFDRRCAPPTLQERPTIWDGFMGRGTTGMACGLLGLNFIGIDHEMSRVDLARRYLGM